MCPGTLSAMRGFFFNNGMLEYFGFLLLVDFSWLLETEIVCDFVKLTRNELLEANGYLKSVICFKDALFSQTAFN